MHGGSGTARNLIDTAPTRMRFLSYVVAFVPFRDGSIARKVIAFGLVAVVLSHGSEVKASDLTAEANRILKTYCFGCHGEKRNGRDQLDVLNVASLIEHGYIVEKNAEESYLWQRMSSGEMPPEPRKSVTSRELDAIAQWINAGASEQAIDRRSLIRNEELVTAIFNDLMLAASNDRIYLRYFSLTHLHNNPQVNNEDMANFRAAFVKTLNSVSRDPNIYVPETIDPHQTIFRVDVRRLDWDVSRWHYLIGQYPYGFNLHNHIDQQIADLDRQIDQMTDTTLCWIRADWFVAKASRSPLYEELLDLPKDLYELEVMLGVDVEKNYLTDQAMRAGFVNSGVSTGHRMLERHRSRDGYYWKSFDFSVAGVSRDVIRKPLGPKFKGNPFDDLAFEHDGGEIIFSLPNGLQAYLLVNSNGKAIEVAPVTIVRDSQETGGTPEVINAVSCINCHRHGIIPFQDDVREGNGVFGQARVKVRQLFPPQKVMDLQVQRDRRTYINALAQVIEPFLRNQDNMERPIEEFEEPVGKLVRFYDRSLALAAIASEFGIAPEELHLNPQHVRMGLGPVLQGGSIKRQRWENLEVFVSPFQQTIQSLGIATPVR